MQTPQLCITQPWGFNLSLDTVVFLCKRQMTRSLVSSMNYFSSPLSMEKEALLYIRGPVLGFACYESRSMFVPPLFGYDSPSDGPWVTTLLASILDTLVLSCFCAPSPRGIVTCCCI